MSPLAAMPRRPALMRATGTPMATLARQREFLARRRCGHRAVAWHAAVARVLRRSTTAVTVSVGVFAPRFRIDWRNAAAPTTPSAVFPRLPAADLRMTLQRLHQRVGHSVLIHAAAAAPAPVDRQAVRAPTPPALRTVARQAHVRDADHPVAQVARERHADYPRLALILVQTRPRGLDAARRPAEAGATSAGTRLAPVPAFAARGAAPAALPLHELARVTDHVLRTLGRRALSLRERTAAR